MILYSPVRVEDGAFLNVGNLFGARPQDYIQFGLKGHNGLDFVAKNGTPIYAAHDGDLIFANDLNPNGTYRGFGKYARIENADGWTYYAHQLRFEGVSRKVKALEKIGYVDSTGYSTGPHLHFGFRPRIHDLNNGFGGCVDPLPFLDEEIPMTKYFKVNDHGKLGIMILEGFTGTIIFENDFGDYQKLLQITGIDDQTPTISLP